MRILVTGSRDWPFPEIVWAQLDRAALSVFEEIVVVEGACPSGADLYAQVWVGRAQARGGRVRSERHPADWAKNNRGAGVMRNQEMVDLGADLCLAFVFNGSKGASDCLNRALTAGIKCRVIELRIAE